LVRHGETEWNYDKRIQGHTDIPLNTRGRGQAESLGSRLAIVPLDTIYTSDLVRARETAEIIAASQPREIPVAIMPDLRECNYGRWEGLTREEVSQQFEGDWKDWIKGGRIGSPTGGEDFISLVRRAGRAFDMAVNEQKTALISTHRVTLRAILCYALGLDHALRDRFVVLNCSLSALECHPAHRPRLILLNDTCHLDDIEKKA
jgi:broad specificity phosphatase PhoE